MKRIVPSEENKSIEADFIVKCIIIGDCSVGKTTILRNLTEEDFTFNPNQVSTIGIDFGTLYLESPDKKILKNQIWDCAGQERFRSIIDSYYRKSNIVFLIYDITDSASFAGLNTWMDKIRKKIHNLDEVVFMVIGNKHDLENKNLRQVSREDGEKFAASINANFIETSAKNGENIFEIFNIANMILYKKHLLGEIELMTSTLKIYKKYGFDEDEEHFKGCGPCVIS